MSAVKMLVVDRDGLLVRRLTEHLAANGFDCRQTATIKETQKMFGEWVPDIVMIELALADGTALDFLSWLKTHAIYGKMPVRVAVTSAQSNVENVRKCFAAGAVDYIVKPLRMDTLIQRFAFFLQEKREITEEKKQAEAKGSGDYYLNLVELVLREANSGREPRAILFNLTKMLSMILSAVRCSIIECNRDTFEGLVKVSNDDFNVKDLKLDLNKYPEVLYVMNKEQMVAIENIDSNPVLAEIRKHVQSIQFSAMIVCPVRKNGQFYGAISVRMGKRTSPYSERELRFAQLIAHVASLVISSGQLGSMGESLPPVTESA